MVLLQVGLFLMMCAVALGWVARHFKFPYPIALVIGGALLGFVPRLQFDPQFLLVLVLPPILYQAALLTSWHEFKANIRPIGLLAIGLVIATTLAVGDRKSTRLNSSHLVISYAVFCLKKKKKKNTTIY